MYVTGQDYTINVTNRPPVNQKQEPLVNEAKEALWEELNSRVDEVRINWEKGNHAPIEGGISIGELPDAVYEDPGEIVFRALTPYENQYNRCKQYAENGLISDYFFYLDPSMIGEQAQKLVEGEAYNPEDPSNTVFVKGLCEWFGEEDVSAVAKSYEALVKEYAGYLETGRAPDVSQLRTAFTFRGEEISVSDIFEMRDVARALKDVDYGSSNGTGMHIDFANLGMIKVAAEEYAQKLPEGIKATFSERFASMVQNTYQRRMQSWKEDSYIKGFIGQDYYNRVTKAAELAYSLFSKGDLTQANVQSKINQLTDSFKDYYHPDSVTICNRNVNMAFQVIKRAIS